MKIAFSGIYAEKPALPGPRGRRVTFPVVLLIALLAFWGWPSQAVVPMVASARQAETEPADSTALTPFLIRAWGSSISGDGQFNRPRAVALDSSSNVYVADTNNNRVQKMDKNGSFVLKWGAAGSGDGQFSTRGHRRRRFRRGVRGRHRQ